MQISGTFLAYFLGKSFKPLPLFYCLSTNPLQKSVPPFFYLFSLSLSWLLRQSRWELIESAHLGPGFDNGSANLPGFDLPSLLSLSPPPSPSACPPATSSCNTQCGRFRQQQDTIYCSQAERPRECKIWITISLRSSIKYCHQILGQKTWIYDLL